MHHEHLGPAIGLTVVALLFLSIFLILAWPRKPRSYETGFPQAKNGVVEDVDGVLYTKDGRASIRKHRVPTELDF